MLFNRELLGALRAAVGGSPTAAARLGSPGANIWYFTTGERGLRKDYTEGCTPLKATSRHGRLVNLACYLGNKRH